MDPSRPTAAPPRIDDGGLVDDRGPIDERGAGARWVVVAMMLRAAAGVVSGRVLLLAAMGLAAAETGVWALTVWSPEEERLLPVPVSQAERIDPVGLIAAGGANQAGFWWSLVGPFCVLPPLEGADAGALLAGVWRLIVWSLFGVAIARVAAMHLTDNDRPSLRTALGRSLGGWPGQAAGPLVLLLLIGLLVAVVWLLGVVSRFSILGFLIALGWPVVIVLGLVAALFGIGLAAGGPLMLASQGVERPDPFDAVSCGLAYVYQQPLRLVAYAGQALAVGAVAGAILLVVTETTAAIAGGWFQAVGGFERGAALGGIPAIARFWFGLFRFTPLIFHAGYFWSAATAVYLLLRRDIDEKQADEVHHDDVHHDRANHEEPAAPDPEPGDA